MIILYSILSAMFFIVALSSYNFTKKTWAEYIKPGQDILDNEHRLHHVLMAASTSISAIGLSILYMMCIAFVAIVPDYSYVVPTLFILKQIMLAFFVLVVLVFVKHVDDEENPEHRFYRGAK